MPLKKKKAKVRKTDVKIEKTKSPAFHEALAAMKNPDDRSTWTVADHRREIARLKTLRERSHTELRKMQAQLDVALKLYEEESIVLEEKLAEQAIDIRRQPRRVRSSLECVGWKQTAECDPNGKREPTMDKKCNQFVPGGISGYCELRDRDTDEHFRVMQLNCSSVRKEVTFSCVNSADFANFPALSDQVVQQARQSLPKPLRHGDGNGIVMVMYPKLAASAFATIRMLRAHKCTLPIEVWLLESEIMRAPKTKFVLKELERQYGTIIVRYIRDVHITGFATKVHAIYHSQFENVLFLDSDNVPVKDPTYLFDSPQFQEKGAIFWPDFWHPKNSIFHINELSLLWQLIDMKFVDMFEQESGQILINRRKSAIALELAQFYAMHKPNHFDKLLLAHGDKDLFRLAWLKTETPFSMIPYPPGSAGPVRKDRFCGMTMVQYDPQGEIIFLHRNSKKLVGTVRDIQYQQFWTHVQSFDWRRQQSDEIDSAVLEHDGIDGQNDNEMMSYAEITDRYFMGIEASPSRFRELQSCYGAGEEYRKYFNLTSFYDLPFATIEEELIGYAQEAAQLLTGH